MPVERVKRRGCNSTPRGGGSAVDLEEQIRPGGADGRATVRNKRGACISHDPINQLYIIRGERVRKLQADARGAVS